MRRDRCAFRTWRYLLAWRAPRQRYGEDAQERTTPLLPDAARIRVNAIARTAATIATKARAAFRTYAVCISVLASFWDTRLGGVPSSTQRGFRCSLAMEMPCTSRPLHHARSSVVKDERGSAIADYSASSVQVPSIESEQNCRHSIRSADTPRDATQSSVE